MTASYFIIAIRFLAKNKAFSFINIVGLSLGLACAMLMVLYAKDELSFDKFHKDLGSRFLITIDVQNPDGSSFDKMGASSMLHGPRFKDNVPEVESFVRLRNIFKDVKLGDEVNSQQILEADSNFFSFFTFPLIAGNAETALQDTRNIVISEDMAMRHFGVADALNNIILVETDGKFIPYTVTGISKRCPQNSSIRFEAVLPIETGNESNWVNVSMTTFVKLIEGSEPKNVASKMQKVFEAESRETMEEIRRYGFDQFFFHQLLSLADFHLNQQYKADPGIKSSNPIYSKILSGIALFILVIACINFINLTIARSAKRAREIGIRKVVGGSRKQLIRQFLGESFLICFISFASATVIVRTLLPMFNDLLNKELSFAYLFDGTLIAIYGSILLLTGFLAGFYPAVVLSGYSAVQTLYSKFTLPRENNLQKSLIIFQFALATFMVISTATVYLQFEYLVTKDLGYDPEDVVMVSKRNLSPRESRIFREQLSAEPSIISTSVQRRWSENGKINGDSIMNFTYESVDENFIDLLEIQLVKGRNFSSLNPSDSANAAIVNVAFVKQAGWTDPLGQEVRMMDGRNARVIGVIKDYHYESLKKSIEPQLLSLAFASHSPHDYQQQLIKIRPGSESATIPFIEKTFKNLFPMNPYRYEFYDDANLFNYEAESKWKKVILLSALLTIFIAGIGLFGLSILTAESRYKEIGVRKVLGATSTNIVLMLYRGNLGLIGVALLIAIPAAYYATDAWLQTYPFRVSPGLQIYVGAGLFVMLIATATISYKSIKTALSNPVDSLRTE